MPTPLRRRLRLARRAAFYVVAIGLVCVALLVGALSQALPLVERHPDRVQAWLFDPGRLAREYPESAITVPFPFNAFYDKEEAPEVDAQSYRLAFWQVASEEINYRRFFDINDLAGLRVERAELFEAMHRLVLARVRSGDVQGLRVDHIDGLYDPRQYCERLAQACVAAPVPTWILLEKILAPHEELPGDWPVAGTTGYDYMNRANGLAVSIAGLERLTGFYARSLHRDHEGEFEFNLDWKPVESFPVRFGWLRAIRLGHIRVQAGLSVSAPVLGSGANQWLQPRIRR